MKTACEAKLRIIAMILAIAPTQLSAKVANCNDVDSSFEYLDENVVFCFSKESLATYMDMAEIFDLDGMNYLVRTGECNFVPTGKYLPLENYKSQMIDSEAVIATDVEDITLWTFKKLVSEGNLEEPEIGYGDTFMLTLARIDQKTGQCR